MRFRIPILEGILVIVENFSRQNVFLLIYFILFFYETAFVILKGKKRAFGKTLLKRSGFDMIRDF